MGNNESARVGFDIADFVSRTLAEDLYVVLGGYDAAAQSADLQVSINPLVNWIWFGFAVLAFFTIRARFKPHSTG